jgi:hypothetical protein
MRPDRSPLFDASVPIPAPDRVLASAGTRRLDDIRSFTLDLPGSPASGGRNMAAAEARR